MRVFSAFTGVGGFELGLPEGWEVIGMSEVDKNANKVLRYRFSGVKNYGDIEKINYGEIPDFDVLVGGSPCQDLSLAGKREGLVGSKSRLFYSYVSILKEKHPRYFVFENVAGLLSSNQGWDFAEVQNQFSEAGYSIWWQVLDAKDFGIPQHRERVFISGSLGNEPLAKVFLKPEHHKEDNGISGQTANTIRVTYKRSQAVGSYVVTAKTLTSSYHSKETERGNLVAESELDTQIENIHFDRSQQNRIYGTGRIAPTLHRKTGGSQVAKIALPEIGNVIIVHSMMPRSGDKTKGGTGHLATPLPYSRTVDTQNSQAIEMNGRIRYLTPLECERLMGWPDDWTRWGVDDGGNKVELSDNARYNLIGNGVVPQVVSAVIKEVIMPFLSSK